MLCDRAGCPACEDRGYTVLTECPLKVSAGVTGLIKLIEFGGKGLMPVTGGTLVQSNWFMQAMDYFQTQENYCRAAKGIG